MDRKTTGQRLKEVRVRKGLTQPDLGELMGGVAKSELSRLERGNRKHLDFEKLERWANALGVRVEVVLWEDGDLAEGAEGFVELLPDVDPDAVAIARDVVALWTDLSPDNQQTLIGLLGQWRRAIEKQRS